MMKKRLQSGFAHPGLILLLLVAVAIGMIGYKVVQTRDKNTNSPNTSVATQPTQTIKSQADLNTAEASLNAQAIDSDLNPSIYNQDVNSLL
jgi:uncharacterized protein HemX